ncbi:MAG: nucleotidyltransferase family protein [Rhodocyclaceae bacterium]
MILAAGRGERMRPLTDHRPKPLLEVGGKPLIVWHIEKLARAGFHDIVINHAHLGGMIETALGNGRVLGVAIRYSPEAEALETAGGIVQALPLLGDAPFLVVNGDVFCDLPLAPFAARGLTRMTTRAALAHLAMVPNPAHHVGGDFVLGEDGALSEDGAERLTFAGIGVYRPELFAGIERGSKAKLGPLLRTAMAEHRASGELFDGRWVDVGTPERLRRLDSALYLTGH